MVHKSIHDWNSKNGLKRISKLQLDKALQEQSEPDFASECTFLTNRLVKTTIRNEGSMYLSKKPNIVLTKGNRSIQADYSHFMDHSALEAIAEFMEAFVRSCPEISQ
jgi:hypothetical protein